MRRNARVDGNQPELVDGLRRCGFRVEVVSMLGQGRPDLIVGRRGHLRWVEVKDPAKAPSKRRLTPDERAWHDKWPGYVITAETVEDVILAFDRLDDGVAVP